MQSSRSITRAHLSCPILRGFSVVLSALLLSCSSSDGQEPQTKVDAGPLWDTGFGAGGSGGYGKDAQDSSQDLSPEVNSQCPATWSSPLPAEVTALTLESSVLYAGGTDGERGWVWALDACTGQLKTSKSFKASDSNSTIINSITTLFGDVYVGGLALGGADPQDGLYARLDKDLTTLQGPWRLSFSVGADEVNAISATTEGLWLFGTKDSGGTSPAAWGVKASTTGEYCDFAAPCTSPSQGSYVIAGMGGAVMATRVGQQVTLFVYSDSTCKGEAGCSCNPTTQAALTGIGGAGTIPYSGVVANAGGTITGYLAGAAYDQPGAQTYAYVARIDVVLKGVAGVYKLDPSAAQAFTALASDGTTAVYVGGGAAPGDAGGVGGTALLTALPLAIENSGTTPLWTTSLPSLRAIRSLQSESSGTGLFVAASAGNAGSGLVMKCTKSGSCP